MEKNNFWGIGKDVAPKAKVKVKFPENGKAQIISSKGNEKKTYNVVLFDPSVVDQLEKIADLEFETNT